MKKIIAVMLAVILTMTISIVPAFAADEKTITSGKIENIIADYFSTVTGIEDAELEISDELVKEVMGGSIVDTAKNLGSIAFLKADDVDADKFAALMADTKTSILVNEDGSVELYVAVNLADHPELYDVAMFRSFVKTAVDNSNEYFKEHGYDPETTDKKLVYDDYLRFAGELALHMMVYNILSPFAFGSSGIIEDLVNKAVYAEINHSENRAPIWFCVVIGYYFMNIARFIKIF